MAANPAKGSRQRWHLIYDATALSLAIVMARKYPSILSTSGSIPTLAFRRGKGLPPFYEVAFLGVDTSFSNDMAESTDLADTEHVAKIRISSIKAKVWAFTMDLGFATAFSWIP